MNGADLRTHEHGLSLSVFARKHIRRLEEEYALLLQEWDSQAHTVELRWPQAALQAEEEPTQRFELPRVLVQPFLKKLKRYLRVHWPDVDWRLRVLGPNGQEELVYERKRRGSYTRRSRSKRPFSWLKEAASHPSDYSQRLGTERSAALGKPKHSTPYD